MLFMHVFKICLNALDLLYTIRAQYIITILTETEPGEELDH